MKVLIVDDETPARERLRGLLAEIGCCGLVAEAATGAQAIATADREAPDVVLLDIRMPEMSGIEAARHLNQLAQPPAIIFVTAYDEHALEAFDAHAIGYLLKPVRREKLAAAILRAQRPTKPQLASLASAGSVPRRTHLSVRARHELRLIPVANILYFLAEQKYVTVHHSGGADLLEDSLRTLEEELAPYFVRIHRNALVAIRHVDSIERSEDGQYSVRLRNHVRELPVSRRLATEVLRRFKR